MSSSPTERSSIARTASRLRLAVWIICSLMVLAYVAGRLGIASDFVRLESRSSFGQSREAMLVADLLVLLLVIAIARLSQMLGAIAGGDLFSARVIRGFRSFAFWLLLFASVGIAAQWLLAAIVRQADNRHHLAMQFDLGDLLLLGFALILFLVARLLERARQIEDEMREIV